MYLSRSLYLYFRNFLDETFFFLQVAVVLTCFQSDKSQNEFDWMKSFSLKRFTKLFKINFRGSKPKKSHLGNFPFSFCLSLYHNTILQFVKTFRITTFLEKHWKLSRKHAIMNKLSVQILNRKLMHRWILLAEKLWLHIASKRQCNRNP